jgi:hypothetical protein
MHKHAKSRPVGRLNASMLLTHTAFFLHPVGSRKDHTTRKEFQGAIIKPNDSGYQYINKQKEQTSDKKVYFS